MNVSRRGFTGAGLALSALAGCDLIARGASLTYRLRVIVRSDESTYEGASAIKVRWRDQRGTIGAVGSQFSHEERGEAVSVPIANNDYIFGLLDSLDPNAENYLASLPLRVLARSASAKNVSADEFVQFIADAKKQRTEIVLSQENYPVFVRFRDRNNPRSIELLPVDDFSTQCGVSLDRVTFQVVEDDSTHKIEKILPWLKELEPRDAYRPDAPRIGSTVLTKYFFVRR